jgi:hypothetical protein
MGIMAGNILKKIFNMGRVLLNGLGLIISSISPERDNLFKIENILDKASSSSGEMLFR